ncbi:MAG: cadmium-translocating P-type ATPase [Lachnospiraceae bacterium]|nr:cadmium-translocating P-type ATPase [Lachnospiraceae bacterium]
MTKKQKIMLCRIIITAVLLIIFQFIPIDGLYRFFIYLIPYLIIGFDILKKAVHGIINLKPFDENFLMAIATVGAFVIALINHSGDYLEAVAVMLFYQIGEFFQSVAVGRSRKNISALMDIRPDHANIRNDNGELERVDPDDVEIGSVIIVNPGEKIPIDGIVTEGRSTLDTKALTGESVPRTAEKDDEVISGCINMSGVLSIRTTKEFGDSTVSKILELVEDSTSRKSKSEAFITRFARVYTPVVCLSALALSILPPLINIAFHNLPGWSDWIYRALTFLVISCPCALVISIPLSFFAGIGGASREGVLVKGSNYLEALSKTRTVAFDKTGTMTKGVFEVNDLHHSSLDREKLLFFAAHAESASSHPIAQSIIRAYGKSIDETIVADVEEIGGNGIKATVDGHLVAAGNSRLMEKLGISCIDCHSIGTIVHIAIDNEYCGHLVISDTVKESAHEAVRSLKAAGVRRTVMLTGDLKRIGEEIANRLDIDEVYSELLPHEKVEAVERLLSEKENEKDIVAFVGDGINDAPVLGRADIGIAMGALGSDAAIEASDIVLMDDDPLKISKAIRISKKCMRIVYENIWFAIGVKLVCLMLGALGIANMWIAIFADVGVMIIAVLNAIRALFVKRL